MKPRLKLASAPTPDGGEMELIQHDTDFFIKVNGHDLMHSRHNESEKELARLGCAALSAKENPRVLIGGLGLGYTLRAALDFLPPDAEVTVVELMEAVINWNRDYLGALNDHPLSDPRVKVRNEDIITFISGQYNYFDAVLLDIDNGPEPISCTNNGRLYGYQGICAISRAMTSRGCLAVWSSAPNREFEEGLSGCGLAVRRFRVPAYPGSRSQSRFIFVAAKNATIIPPGGSAPYPAGRGRGKKKGGRRK